MRKICLFVLALSAGVVHADGIYEGIWQIQDGSFATVNQNGNTAVVAVLNPESLSYEAYIGTVSGNIATLNSVLAFATIELRVVFQSNTSAIATIQYCLPNPGYVCSYPIGTQFTASKIF